MTVKCLASTVDETFDAAKHYIRGAEPCKSPGGKRSCETICIHVQKGHGPHRLEPALRERSLKAVCGKPEPRDYAHRSNATLWKCSFETIPVYHEFAQGPHHLEPAPRECSLEAVYGDQE
eukprot:4447586-Amphidinium_carterae.1